MSFKRGGRKRVDRYDLRYVWRRLPPHLKSFDGWLYSAGPDGGGDPTGLRDWLTAVTDWLHVEFGNDPKAPTAVQVGAVGGLTFEVWYREMLSRSGRRLVSVPTL